MFQVLGGSSSVGAAAIQLLRLALPEALILTTCSSKHHARMSDLGANHAFDRDALLDEIRAVTMAHAGVDCILGAVEGKLTVPGRHAFVFRDSCGSCWLRDA